jgi:hypothetical protein
MDKLTPPSNLVQFKTASQLNATQSRDDLHKLERLEAASEAAIKAFEACVDFGKADTTALLATVSEYLAGLDPTMLARVGRLLHSRLSVWLNGFTVEFPAEIRKRAECRLSELCACVCESAIVK